MICARPSIGSTDASNNPKSIIEEFYKEYLNSKKNQKTLKPSLAFSKSLKDLVSRNSQLCHQKAPTDICGWGADEDVYLETQEVDPQLNYDNSGFKIFEIEPENIRVTFNVYPSVKDTGDHYYLKNILFLMLKEAGAWVVDDIYYDGTAKSSVRQRLSSEMSTFQRAAPTNVTLGILEDKAGEAGENAHTYSVRVVFEKVGSAWRSLEVQCQDIVCLSKAPTQFPARTEWSVTFNGKVIGRILGKMPPAFRAYNQMGQQEISTPLAKVPTRGRRSIEFAGWSDRAVHRPLVAYTGSGFKSADHWKSFNPPSTTVARLKTAFRKKFPAVSNCNNEYDTSSKPFNYSNDDIEISKTYSSTRSWAIARVTLKGYRCDGPIDLPFEGHWFRLSPQGEIAYLDYGLSLVDTGDYDNDGVDELIFAIDRYDLGGYLLFTGNFDKRSSFSFGYH